MRGVKFNIKHLDYQSKAGTNTNTHTVNRKGDMTEWETNKQANRQPGHKETRTIQGRKQEKEKDHKRR